MEIKVNDIILTTDFTRADVDYSIKRHTKIFSEEFGFTDAFNEMVKKIISDFPAEYNAEKDFMLVARTADGRFAGTITLLGEENGVGRLRYFFVEPFTRGKGVGKLIFTTAMSLAKDMGYKHLWFTTYNKLVVARTMYRQLGFEVTKEMPAEDEAGVGGIEEIWEKDI